MEIISKSLTLIEEAGGKDKIEKNIAALAEGGHGNTAFLLFRLERHYPDLIVQPRNPIPQDVIRTAINRWGTETFGGLLYQNGFTTKIKGHNYHLIARRKSVREGSYELFLITNVDRSISEEYQASTIALTALLIAMSAAIFPALLSVTISVKENTKFLEDDGVIPSFYWTEEAYYLFTSIKQYKIESELAKTQINQSTSGQVVVKAFGQEEGIMYNPNKALSEITGYTHAELNEQPLNLIVQKQFHPFHEGIGVFAPDLGRRSGMHAYANGCPFHGHQQSKIVGRDRTVDLLHKDGSVRKIILGVDYIGKDDDGKDTWVGVLTDVTELTDAVAKAEQAAAAELFSREELEKLQQSWRHDLLSAVLGAHNMFEVLDNIGFRVESEQYQEPYNIARAKAEFAYKLVRDTRDLTASLENMEKEAVTLQTLLASIKILYPEGNITYTIEDGEKRILINESSFIGRAISNLINNAIKFSGLNGVVEVGIRTKNESAIIYVKDNGIGIDEAGQKKIFSGFGAGVRLNQEIRGDGFGLHSAMNIVHAHGGTLTVKSKLGQGSVFFIKIPLLT